MRRFRLRNLLDESGALSLDALLELFKEAMSFSEEDSFQFYYEDSDGDKVVVSTTRELSDAITSFRNNDSLKLVAVQSTGQENQGSRWGGPTRLITDSAVTKRLLSIMRARELDPVLYKNNLVDESNKVVLTHLVDDFKDHISASFAPPVVSADRKLWYTYTVNGRQERSRYLAVDGIYLDLTVEQESGKVKLLFPRPIFNKLAPGAKTCGLSHRWLCGNYG